MHGLRADEPADRRARRAKSATQTRLMVLAELVELLTSRHWMTVSDASKLALSTSWLSVMFFERTLVAAGSRLRRLADPIALPAALPAQASSC
jgi:hypothetical protein